MADISDQWVEEYVSWLWDYDQERAAEIETEYVEAIQKRNAIIADEFGGDPHGIFTGTREQKDRYNGLSSRIVLIQSEAYDWGTKTDWGNNLEMYMDLEFIHPEREEMKPVFESGWYQNGSGDLFHYDGVIWDTVPKEEIRELEYLG